MTYRAIRHPNTTEAVNATYDLFRFIILRPDAFLFAKKNCKLSSVLSIKMSRSLLSFVCRRLNCSKINICLRENLVDLENLKNMNQIDFLNFKNN